MYYGFISWLALSIFCWGVSVSKHIFTLCCIAAELNALSPSMGHWLQTIQFSTITRSHPLVVCRWLQRYGKWHCTDAIGSLWKLCRMCMDSLIIVSFALLPLWISTVNVCPLHSILIFGSVCLGQFNYWEHPPPPEQVHPRYSPETHLPCNEWLSKYCCLFFCFAPPPPLLGILF